MNIGTPLYMAPEVCDCEDSIPAYNNRVDSWSVGMIVAEMYVLKESGFPDPTDLIFPFLVLG